MRHVCALFFSILSLPLFAAISGTVMTTGGVALAGARVSIQALETPHARRARLVSGTPDAVPLSSAQTDERGSFSLPSPKEPVVELRVDIRGYEPFARAVEREEDVAVALRKMDMVKGSVTAGGKPVARALVVLGADYVTRSDEEGQFEAPAIDPLSYYMAVIHPDYAIDEELLSTGSVPEREWNRTLSAGVTLTGRAVAADGTSPVAGAGIWVDDWPLAVSGEDGAFTIAHAPAKWTNITARKGMLAGTHTAGGARTITVRLEPMGVIAGTVRDAKTNAPLAGTMVGGAVWFMSGMAAPAAVTDAGGTYSIPVPAGSFIVSATHPSHAPASDSTRIVAGQQTTRDFALTPFARVSGVVLDQAGRPVPAALVAPRDPRDLGVVKPADTATPVNTGPDGKFNVRVLPGHDFYLRVSRKGLAQGRSEVMRLAAGERKEEVVLTMPAGVAVTGRALDARGKPLSGVAVVAGPAAPPGGQETLDTALGIVDPDPVRSDADGRFAMRLNEGWYHFRFRREGYLNKEVRTKNITATGDNRVEARLEPAVEISGRVTRGGVGVADVEVGSWGATRVIATTASDGSFVLGGFAPGVRQLELRKRSELIDEKRSVTAPTRGVVIDLPAGGTIRGRVVEKGTNTPIRSFQARALVGLGNLRSFGSEDGSFTIEHVPAGVVTVDVKAFGYLGTHRDVEVVKDQTASVVLELETGVRLTGRVTDANGAPLSGVTVRIGPPPMRGGVIGGTIGGVATRPPPSPVRNDGATTVTDADGRYTLPGLVQREESIYFSHPRYGETIRAVKLEEPETKLDVQLSTPRP